MRGRIVSRPSTWSARSSIASTWTDRWLILSKACRRSRYRWVGERSSKRVSSRREPIRLSVTRSRMRPRARSGSSRPTRGLVFRLHVLDARCDGLSPRGLDDGRELAVELAHSLEQTVDERAVEHGVDIQVPPAVAVGE